MPHIVKPGFTIPVRVNGRRVEARKVVTVSNQGSITTQEWANKQQTPVAVTRVSSAKRGPLFA